MTDHYDQLKPAIDSLEYLIQKYKNVKNVEIEIRLGIIEHSKFTTGLNCLEFYEKIINHLDSYKNWKQIKNINTEELIDGNVKKIDNNFIEKKKLEVIDFCFRGTPYDFRLCVSTEIPCSPKTFCSKIKRNKYRRSYFYKECRFDLTKVIEENDHEIVENEEIEIELINLNSLTSDKYRAHSALLKIRDIINICEIINSDSYIVKMV